MSTQCVRQALWLLVLACYPASLFSESEAQGGPALERYKDGIKLSKIAEQIRKGKIDVGDVYSTDYKLGRLHKIHADSLLMDCSNCHYGLYYKADYLSLGKFKPLVQQSRGRLQKWTCLGCHQLGGMATPFYFGPVTDIPGEK